MNYKEQIKSPLWQKRRLEIMERDNFTCQICGCKDKTLNVHHLCYKDGVKIHEYGNVELITLCEDCHRKEHNGSVANKVSEMKELGFTEYEIYRVLDSITRCFASGFVSNPIYLITRLVDHSFMDTDGEQSYRLYNLDKRRSDATEEDINRRIYENKTKS